MIAGLLLKNIYISLLYIQSCICKQKCIFFPINTYAFMSFMCVIFLTYGLLNPITQHYFTSRSYLKLSESLSAKFTQTSQMKKKEMNDLNLSTVKPVPPNGRQKYNSNSWKKGNWFWEINQWVNLPDVTSFSPKESM